MNTIKHKLRYVDVELSAVCSTRRATSTQDIIGLVCDVDHHEKIILVLLAELS